MPNTPVPTSHFLTKDLYVGSKEIISEISKVFELNEKDFLKDFEEPNGMMFQENGLRGHFSIII